LQNLQTARRSGGDSLGFRTGALSAQAVDHVVESQSANHHAARRGRSRAEFIAKLGLVLEEADESVHWLRIMDAIELGPHAERTVLNAEAEELVLIFARSLKTARTRRP
jgi:four helix bundle protein